MKFPTKHSGKGVLQIHHDASRLNFLNNISVPRVRVNIRETENAKLLKFFRYKHLRQVLSNFIKCSKLRRFTVFRLLENASIIYETPPLLWHDLIISPPI